MAILDSIQKARQRGVPDNKILDEILKQNPGMKTSIETARQRGSDATSILSEIENQNKSVTQNTSKKEVEQKDGFLKSTAKLGADITGISSAFKFGQMPTKVLGSALAAPELEKVAESRGELSEMTTKLIKRMNSLEEGEQKERLRTIVKGNFKEMGVSKEAEAGLLKEMEITPKEVAGTTLEAAGTLVAAKTIPKIEGVSSVTDAFIKGAKIAGKEGVIVGGLIGAGESLQKNEKPIDVLKSAGFSALLSGTIGSIVGGTFSAKQYNAEKTAKKIQDEAIRWYQSGLKTTTNKTKESARKIIPELLDKNWWGSRNKLLEKAKNGLKLASKQYESLGELQGVVDSEDIEKVIRGAMEELQSPSGNVLSINQTKFKTLENILSDISYIKKGTEIPQESLRKIAQQYGGAIYETRSSIKTIEDSKTLSQVKIVDDAIRSLLNNKNPDYAAINKLNHTSGTLKNIIDERMVKEGGQKMMSLTNVISTMTGVGAGGAMGGVGGSVLGGTILMGLSELLDSTWFKTLIAKNKWNIAKNLLKLPLEDMPKTINLLIRGTPEMIDRFTED